MTPRFATIVCLALLMPLALRAQGTKRMPKGAAQVCASFIGQQQGIDGARSAVIEWTYWHNGVKRSDNTFWLKRDCVRVSKRGVGDVPDEHEYYYDFGQNRFIDFSTRRGKQHTVVVYPYIRHSPGLEALSPFFPSLKHFWHERQVRSEVTMWQHHAPERLAPYTAVWQDGAQASITARLIRASLASSPERVPRCAFPPDGFCQVQPGNAAIGCTRESWFDVLEFHRSPLRLVKLTTYCNNARIPLDTIRQLCRTDTPEERLWELQRKHAQVLRILSFGDHRRLARGLVIPFAVSGESFGDRAARFSWQVTRAQIDEELPDNRLTLVIPGGASVRDHTVHPTGEKCAEYRWGSRR